MTWKASSALPPWAVGSVRGPMIFMNSITEPGQSWVMSAVIWFFLPLRMRVSIFSVPPKTIKAKRKMIYQFDSKENSWAASARRPPICVPSYATVQRSIALGGLAGLQQEMSKRKIGNVTTQSGPGSQVGAEMDAGENPAHCRLFRRGGEAVKGTLYSRHDF